MNKFKIISIALFLIAALTLQAKEKFTSSFQKEFDVNRDALVKVNNSFGNIQCFAWEESKVKIEVLVEVTAEDQRQADQVFDKINIDISGSKTLVQERTSIDNMNNRNVQFNIIVNVYLPESLNLDFTNRFGNMFVGIVKGKTKLKQSFGTLQASELQNESNEILVQHGDLQLGEANEAVIEVRHSSFSIEKAKYLKVNADFTQMDFEKIDRLFLDANFGSLELDETGDVEGKFNGTKVKINYLKKSMLADCQLGELQISQLARNFSEIDLSGKHTSIKVGVENDSSFGIDLSARFASVYLPSNFNVSRQKLSFNSYTYQGKIGDKGSNSLIKIDSEFGTIEIN